MVRCNVDGHPLFMQEHAQGVFFGSALRPESARAVLAFAGAAVWMARSAARSAEMSLAKAGTAEASATKVAIPVRSFFMVPPDFRRSWRWLAR
jgi:hypothetical protein